MKVFYDDQIFQLQYFGGISRYFNELKKIDASGVEVEQYSYLESVASDAVSRGLRVVKRTLGMGDGIPRRGSFQGYDPFKGREFDVFHPTYYHSYFLGQLQKPFVLTVHDMTHEIYPELFEGDDQVSYHKQILCEKADKIVTVSHTTREDLIEILGVAPDRVEAIQLASNFHEVQPSVPANWQLDHPFVLYVGNRGSYKNFSFAVRALAALLLADPDLRLVCTGHAFSVAEIAFLRNLKIESQVIQVYLQNDQELAWVYRQARAFIFPSLYEGFGFPLLEAFASDCPVVAARAGSLPEVGGDAPLYAEGKSLSQWQDKMYSAIYDEMAREFMIAKGREQYQQFSWDRFRSQTLNVYQSLLG